MGLSGIFFTAKSLIAPNQKTQKELPQRPNEVEKLTQKLLFLRLRQRKRGHLRSGLDVHVCAVLLKLLGLQSWSVMFSPVQSRPSHLGLFYQSCFFVIQKKILPQTEKLHFWSRFISLCNSMCVQTSGNQVRLHATISLHGVPYQLFTVG